MKNGVGMSTERYELIVKNLPILELDLERGEITNRLIRKPNKRGYYEVILEKKHVPLHQVFGVAIWGENCIGQVVNHKNEIKTDNRAKNYELLSGVENTQEHFRLNAMKREKRVKEARAKIERFMQEKYGS